MLGIDPRQDGILGIFIGHFQHFTTTNGIHPRGSILPEVHKISV